jgi:pimeloyl-[acyl-carrier protein] methyl ester esterase
MLVNTEAVFLHGWGATNKIWKDLLVKINNTTNTSAPCLYDLVSTTNDASFDALAAALNEKLKSDVVLVAWSMGGLIATPLALLTNKIKAIVFIASAPCFINKSNWNNVIDKKGIDNLQVRLSENTSAALEYFSGLIAHGDITAKETNKLIRACLADESNDKVLASWLKQMREVDQSEMLSQIDIPVLFVLGQNDSLINSNIESQIKLLSPNIESQIINDCGHAPFISKQEQTIKIIKEFINARLN